VRKAATASLQDYSARMRALITAVWTGCLLLVAGERFSAVTLQLVQSGFAATEMRAWICQAVSAIPEALFLVALWGIRTALAAFARGELFTAAITHMLERVGVVLVCAAAVRLFVVPGVCRLLGFGAGYWIAFDAAAVIVGAIGLALRVIGAVLRHASELESELEQIF
jgi:hypothetical protein